ncbi:MAG: HTTM domain-containing protein [Labilithrix sp.]|nr:HTTM domain-containing protein [Labilithrix sp.]MCW5815538.1 HTTM domain-containing protein [Labilithrix sp.]
MAAALSRPAPLGAVARTRVLARAWEPVDAASLVAFRFLLGALVAASAIRQWAKGAIHDQFVVPTHFFPYDGLSFVRPLPGDGMYAVYIVLALAGAGLALGVRTRVSGAIAFLAFTYAHACDVTNYLNHYYLVSLLLGIATVLPLGAGHAKLPRWMLWLVRFQIGLVYFYGGVGKLQADWLVRAMPLRIWLAGAGDFPVLGPLLRVDETAWIMSWLGAAFDLSIPFLLLVKRTRPFAYGAVIVFHLVTSRLFQIGMFPWVMIALTLVFFEPSWPRRFVRLRGGVAQVPRWSLPLAAAYAAFQFLYPLRSHLYPGNVLWTEEGYRFSWRVMLIEKAGLAELTAHDPVSGAKREVRARDYLTPLQVKMMSTQPDLVASFARTIADEAERRGERRPRVTADVFVTLNGRPSARLLDPEVDLAAEPPRILPAPSAPSPTTAGDEDVVEAKVVSPAETREGAQPAKTPAAGCSSRGRHERCAVEHGGRRRPRRRDSLPPPNDG